MAIRVKKLAKQMRASPDVILLALSDLGYGRYKSPMDMVADTAAAKVRKLARSDGLPRLPTSTASAAPTPTPTPTPTPKPKPKPTPTPKPKPRSRSSSSIPTERAVSPAGRSGGAADPLDIPIEALLAERGPSPAVPDLDAISAEMKEEERRLQVRGQAVAERTRALEARRAEIEAEQQRIEAERDRLEAERSRLHDEVEALREQLEQRARALDALEAGGVPVTTLLGERGLRGHDEQARALAALAERRLLGSVLDRLRVVDPEPIRALLRGRLVLADAGVTELEGVAVVQVAEDRAELPSASRLERFRQDLAGEFLLVGLRRVRLVGGSHAPTLLRLLRGDLDPRVSIEVTPARSREVLDVASDVSDMDLVILWGVEESDEARTAYDALPVQVVRVGAQGGLPALLDGVRTALREP